MFFASGFLDNQPFIHYNSKSRRAEPSVGWLLEDEVYFEDETQAFTNRMRSFQLSLRNIQQYYNISGAQSADGISQQAGMCLEMVVGWDTELAYLTSSPRVLTGCS